MVTVTARESFVYDGIDRVKGESFEASPEDARVLCLIGKAELPHEPEQSVDVPVDGGEAADTPRRRRTYHRKDIVATQDILAE